MLLRKKIAIILAIPALAILAFTVIKKDYLHIAVVAPLTGEDAKSGNALVNGAQVYVNYLNDKGGVLGKKVQLDSYDDRGNPQVAKQQAEKIVKNGKAIAVIGHISSDCVNAAAPVYEKAQLPVILPASTNVTLTKKYKTLFRFIFNDKHQAQYMSLYAKHFLHANRVVILYSDSLFGKDLKDYLKTFCAKIKLPVMLTEKIDLANANIFTKFSQLREGDVVLLSVDSAVALKSIAFLRKYTKVPIIGPDSVAAIADQANKVFKYKGVYAIAPLLFELCDDAGVRFTALYKETFKEEASWYAVYGHDIAKIILDKVEKYSAKATAKDMGIALKHDFNTASLEKYSKADKKEVTYRTITDPLDFIDQESNRSPQLASIKTFTMSAAPIQLTKVDNISFISDYKQLVKKGWIIKEGQDFFYQTHIVSSGVNINEISNLDISKGVYSLDFYMWFRYSLETPGVVNDIVFLNSVEDIQLPLELSLDKQTKKDDKQTDTFAKLVAQKQDGKNIYKLYRIKNLFRLDAFSRMRPAFHNISHNLGVNFRHLILDQNFIRYAKDSAGGGNNLEHLHATSAMLEQSGWKLVNLSDYEDSMALGSMGNQHYVDFNQEILFSRFNAKINIVDKMFSFFDFITYDLAQIILLMGCLLLFIVEVVKARRQKWKDILNLLDIIPYTIILFSGQMILMQYVVNSDVWYQYKYFIILGFDIVWWMIFANAANMLVQFFAWRKIEDKTGKRVPRLLYWCVSLLIYSVAVFGVIAFVLGMPITSLLASTSLLAFLVVMAVQMNVSNIFSGIFLNVEGAYRVGDWVDIGTTNGWIVQTGWRTTKLQTREGDMISVPNTKVAESIITNYTYPNNRYALGLMINISLNYKPTMIISLLRHASMKIKGVTDVVIFLMQYNGGSAEYKLDLQVENLGKNEERVRSDLYEYLWIEFAKVGINAGTSSIVNMYTHPILPLRAEEEEILINHSVFKVLPAKEQKELFKTGKQIKIKDNKYIESDDKVFVIAAGKVMRKTYDIEGKEQYVELKPGDTIGLGTMQNLEEAKCYTITDTILTSLDASKVLVAMNSNKKLADAIIEYIKFE